MEENTVFQNPLDSQNQGPEEQNPIIGQDQGSEIPIEPPPSMPQQRSFPLFSIAKIIIGLIVVVVIIFLVIKFASSFSKPKNEKVTLTYWGLWEEKSVFAPVIADFEKENPNIKVDYILQDKKTYREKILTRIQNGKGPDIFRFHNTWVSQLTKTLSPLSTDVISKEDFQKIYYPVIAGDLIKNGAIYAIPLGIDTLSLFVNTDIFKSAGVKVPANWDEFRILSRSLTVKDKDTGLIKTSGGALGTFDNITHAPDIISMLFWQSGVNMSNLSETSQNASGVLTFYTDFSKAQDNVWDVSMDPSVIAFAKGSLAMYFGYSWDIFQIKALNKDLNFEVHPVPYLPPNRNMTIASYWVEGVSLKSKYQKEAMAFMKFLARKDTAQKLFTEQSKTRMFGEPYARRDLKDSLKDNAILYPFVQQAENARSSFFASDTYDNGLNDRANVYLGNAVRSILGNTSPESAVKDLSTGITQILKDYGLN